ncbi:MAG: hypothetical protein LBU11_07860 [Zoogloeaceae bacterium]|jgi:hypothetical protein|nr:hypothetical protein [Zoogloeaceae bacterium]
MNKPGKKSAIESEGKPVCLPPTSPLPGTKRCGNPGCGSVFWILESQGKLKASLIPVLKEENGLISILPTDGQLTGSNISSGL